MYILVCTIFMDTISPKELKKRLRDTDTDEELIDVRSPQEFKSAHIEGAENIPLEELKKAAKHLKDIGVVYVTCGTGVRSQQACQILEEEGVEVLNLEGGLTAWVKEGLSVKGNGKKVIPIIRQVMIVAGTLVLIGVLFGIYLSPYWYFLSAFVGAGLLFAGISGICTMSWVLSKMPWNR